MSAIWLPSQRGPSAYSGPQIHALTKYVGSLGGPTIPEVHPEEGNLAKGQKLFTEKHCVSCHGVAGSGAPDLKAQAGNFSAVSMISALWRHGPRMLNSMEQKKISWPRLDGNQMADMIAFLNTR